MAAAILAMDLHARHAVRRVRGGGDRTGQGLKEARPARAALVLGARLEQRVAAAGAVKYAGAFLEVQRARARAFGAVLAQYAELIGGERFAPLLLGFLD